VLKVKEARPNYNTNNENEKAKNQQKICRKTVTNFKKKKNLHDKA
jgi:hypothetical protein